MSCHRDPSVGTEVHSNQSYGSDERNKMDVYLPESRDSSTATLVLIHGGAWVAGDKTNWPIDLINKLTDNRYAVAAINYQYANGDFHHQMRDIALALSYINTQASGWKIASGKFALMGASAGGHLALLYGHAFDSTDQVKAVISMVGPTDMSDTTFHRYANNYNIGSVFEDFLGATYQSNPQVYRDASPLFNISNVPSFFIHGSLDDLVPPAHGVRMFDSLTVHGIPADTTYFDNAGHDVFGPNQVNKQQVYDEIIDWLQLYLQ